MGDTKPKAPVKPKTLPEELVRIADLKPHPRNYKKHPGDQLEHIAYKLRKVGLYKNVVISKDNFILAGHGVVKAASEKLAWPAISARRLPFNHDHPLALKVLVGDNEDARLAEDDDHVLAELLRGIREAEDGILGTGFSDDALAELLSMDAGGDPASGAGRLAEQFLVPPFSVLDARQGYWQDRKRAWLALGIKSELGRVAPIGGGADAAGSSEGGGVKAAFQQTSEREVSMLKRTGDYATGRRRAAPGGSPRPAMKLRGGKTVRGDGAGKAIS